MVAAITDPMLDPLFWKAERVEQPSAWWMHVPFAHWVVAACKPKLFVELGTHTGVSYAAFCEAVRTSKCGARCYAIDTWEGDAHSGNYDHHVYDGLKNFNDDRYSGFSELIRSTFDDALKYFEDGTVDLLHIDGFHTYEAVKHDFDTWLPKLSNSGVVIFHDTNVKHDDFGVYKFFGELQTRYPSFEFSHGFGLGIIIVGNAAPTPILDLCKIEAPEQIAAIRDRFAFAGNGWRIAARETLAGNQALERASAASIAEAERLRLEVNAAEAGRTATVDILEQADAAMIRLVSRFHTLAQDLRDLIQAPGQETSSELNRLIVDGPGPSLVARLEGLEESVGTLTEQTLAGVRTMIDGVRGDNTAQAAEIIDLSASLAEADIAQELATGAQRAADRMRQETALRVGELRRAMDAIGLETTTARAVVRDLAARYSAVLDQLAIARRRDPTVQIPRLIARMKGRKQRRDEAADLFLLENSVYFDKAWYLESYPDVAASGASPVRHYLLHGAFENRDPGPWFSTSQYLLSNPDVAAAGANALLHFVRHGEQEGRSARAAPIIALPREQPSLVAGGILSCIFVSGEPESAGHRYRILDFIEAASANDVAATWVRADDLATHHDDLPRHDIAVFWRVAWTQEVGAAMAVLRRSGCKIVFDVDDLMTEPNLARVSLIDGIRTQSLTEEMVRSHYARVRQTMLEADACITTTEELAFHTRRAGKTTYVVGNGFTRGTHDLSRLSARLRRKTIADDLIRIGYAGGSKTHQRDFAMCVDGLARLLHDEPRCRLVLFRTPNGPLLDPAEFPQLARLQSQIEWRDAVPLVELPRELSRFDINLAPLEFGNPYCEAKSELKFFEAALVNVPTIASPTGPFRRAIDHGKTGFLAASADDWLFCLRRLVDDAGLRSDMGAAAYRAALARFGPETKALRFGNVLEQLRGGVAGTRAFALDVRLVNRRPPAPGIYPSNIIFEYDAQKSADVTVVVPLYNYQDLIEETLDSVSAQTADVLDLVIVDGYSTDGSLAVAQRWAERNAERFNRILVLQNSANYGLGFCRNSGIDAAETAYVVLLDADNLLLPEACVELVDHAKLTGAAFVYPTIQHFGASGAVGGNAPFEPQRLAAGNFIDAMALVSKEAWAIVGGVDHVQHGWEDYDFWCRIAELGLRGEWLSRPLAQYRVHAASMQKVQTQVPDNYRRLLATFKQRHPWVSLHDQEQSRRPPAPRQTLVGPKDRSRLDTLLPVLRCPVTFEKLGFNAERTALHSFDGLCAWPVKMGRPVFTPRDVDVDMRSQDHHGDALSGPEFELVRETRGWILNLGAAGGAERTENVIEAGYAIAQNTDIVVEAHALPFDDDVFDVAIVYNTLEYYSEPQRAAAELYRVLKPGGKLLIISGVAQPLHEKSSNFYNPARSGLQEWFVALQAESLELPGYLNPNFTMGRIAAEIEVALRAELGDRAADGFLLTRIDDLVRAFRDPALRDQAFWHDVSRLSQSGQEIVPAGFEFIGQKGDGIPVYVKHAPQTAE